MIAMVKILGTNQNEYPSPLQHTAERALTIVVVILSVFSSILVSVIIVYVLWRVKGPYLSNWRSFQNVSPIREQHTPQKATSQQRVSLDMSQRTNDTYCSSYDADHFNILITQWMFLQKIYLHNFIVMCRRGKGA